MQNIETYVKEKVKKFPFCAETPLGSHYQPEIDLTPELQAKDTAYYQLLIIGILR